MHDILRKSSVFRRVLVLAIGCIARSCSNAGQLIGQVKRFEVMSLGRRFDFFVGKNPDAVSFERARSALFISIVLVFFTLFIGASFP